MSIRLSIRMLSLRTKMRTHLFPRRTRWSACTTRRCLQLPVPVVTAVIRCSVPAGPQDWLPGHWRLELQQGGHGLSTITHPHGCGSDEGIIQYFNITWFGAKIYSAIEMYTKQLLEEIKNRRIKHFGTLKDDILIKLSTSSTWFGDKIHSAIEMFTKQLKEEIKKRWMKHFGSLKDDSLIKQSTSSPGDKFFLKRVFKIKVASMKYWKFPGK